MINALKSIEHTVYKMKIAYFISINFRDFKLACGSNCFQIGASSIAFKMRYDYIHLFIYQISSNNFMMTFIQILCQKYSCEFC